MRRREFLRAALGAVAGLAIGAPVVARARPRNPGLGTVDHVLAWPRALTAGECEALFNEGAGVALGLLQENLVESRFFSIPGER